MPEWVLPIIDALGGGFQAVAFVAMALVIVVLWRRSILLTSMLMDRKDDELRSSVERETAVRMTLERIATLMEVRR